MAYTYLIGWTNLDLYYYGVRYAKGCDPSDLWTSYFTSSKKVKYIRNTHGEPNIIKIRRLFINRRKALIWEQKVLRRLDVLHNDRFLNANIGGTYLWNGVPKGTVPWNKGKSMSDEQKKLIGDTRRRLGLGKRDVRHLPVLWGDDNPMRRPEVSRKLAQQITGRKRAYRPDGTWYWHHPKD